MTTLIDVPSAGNKKRPIRFDDELWDDYGRACEAEGINRSEDLRAHAQRKVQEWKAQLEEASEQDSAS